MPWPDRPPLTLTLASGCAPARAAGERSGGPWALPGPRGVDSLLSRYECECRRGLPRSPSALAETLSDKAVERLEGSRVFHRESDGVMYPSVCDRREKRQ